MVDDPRVALAQFGHDQDGIVSLYLFGSRASGRAHRGSDIDVAVFLDRKMYSDRGLRFDARVRLTSLLIGALRFNGVDLVILNDVSPGFARASVTNGKRLFCATLRWTTPSFARR